MDSLLTKVKQNLILEHSADDTLLQTYITAAVAYAESYQHIPEGTYKEIAMPATTEQAVIMLASHFYESRDGSHALINGCGKALCVLHLFENAEIDKGVHFAKAHITPSNLGQGEGAD